MAVNEHTGFIDNFKVKDGFRQPCCQYCGTSESSRSMSRFRAHVEAFMALL